MKAIFLSILIILVVYFVSIFAFPVYADKLAEFFGKTHLNEQLRSYKTDIENKITSLNIFGQITETKQKALEVKQNISSGIVETQEKLETIK